MIEFALTLPLLLLLMVGIFDFGMLFQHYEVLTNAAREGARLAVLPGYSTGDVQSRVATYMSAGGVTISPTTVVDSTTITPPGVGAAFPAVRVTVDSPYTFSLLGPVSTLFGSSFGTITLSATSIMRAEVSTGGD